MGGGELAAPPTNRDVGDRVHLGVEAVKTNLRSLFKLFGIDDLPQNQKRVRLVQLALREGIVSRSDLD